MRTDSRWLSGTIIPRLVAAVLVVGLLMGWGIDRFRQQKRLAPLLWEKSDLKSHLARRQTLLLEAEKSPGFHGWLQVEATIACIPSSLIRPYAQRLTWAADDVYSEAVPKLIAILDHDDALRRERAWKMLEEAKKSPRFSHFEESYRDGVVALLRHPSTNDMEDILAWFRREKVDSPAVLAALRERMMDDNDRYAPFFAYTLAELDSSSDIAPRLVEMIEDQHSQWKSIIHQLPRYMPEEEADVYFKKYNISR